MAFFDAQGNPLVGFVEKGTNGIVLFSRPSGASSRGDVISNITRAKVDAYVEMLQRRLKEENQAREAQIEKARQASLIEEERHRRAQESNAVVQAKSEEERKRLAESNAVLKAQADLAAYRDHHIALNTSFDRAVLIVNETDNQNMPLSSLVADLLAKDGVTATPSFFKPAFIKDGLFREVFAGQSDVANRLPLTNALRSIVFGRQTVSYKKNSELKDVVSASMMLEISANSARTLQSLSSQRITAVGAGFTEDEARQMAEDRIISQLTNGIVAKLDQALSAK